MSDVQLICLKFCSHSKSEREFLKIFGWSSEHSV